MSYSVDIIDAAVSVVDTAAVPDTVWVVFVTACVLCLRSKVFSLTLDAECAEERFHLFVILLATSAARLEVYVKIFFAIMPPNGSYTEHVDEERKVRKESRHGCKKEAASWSGRVLPQGSWSKHKENSLRPASAWRKVKALTYGRKVTQRSLTSALHNIARVV